LNETAFLFTACCVSLLTCQLAIQEASTQLDDPVLVGEPRLPEDIMKMHAAFNGAAGALAGGGGAAGAASSAAAAGTNGPLQQGGFAANSIYMGQ
jgi:hypothetical protein